VVIFDEAHNLVSILNANRHHHHLLCQKAAHKHLKITHNHETSKTITQILLKAPPKTSNAQHQWLY